MQKMFSSGIVLVAILLLFSAPLRAEENVHGCSLIPWAVKVADSRYRSPRDFDDTVKWYQKLYAGNRNIKLQRVVNVPGIKYLHIKNHSAKAKWSGMNIYQAGARGEVRIYVLKAVDAK